MANKRVLIKRRKAVRNIHKITRTMQLIATARFQAAFKRTVATKPYTKKLTELVADLSDADDDVDHPLMKTHDDVKESAMVVITSKRGLCGGYNSNVLRTAIHHLDEQGKAGVETAVHMVGTKGINYFRFLGRPLAEQLTDISEVPRFDEIERMANGLMDRFAKGEISSVYVAHMSFLSAAKQKSVVLRLLPLSREAKDDRETSAKRTAVEYEFSPAPKELLDELLPATVRARMFQCFTDATVSEHIARMVAMKAATDAAEDMIKLLSRQYNRARQTHITMELLDIIGGANAIS